MHFETIQGGLTGLTISLTDTLGLLAANGFLDSLGWALIHSSWQGCIAAAIVMAFRSIFKKAGPALRYSVQIAALFGLFLAFISTVVIYQTDVVPSNLNTTKLAFSLPFPSQLGLQTLEATTLSTPLATPVSNVQIVGEIGQMTPLISLFWVIGFLYLFARYSAAYLLTRKLRNSGLSSVPEVWSRRFEILLANTGITSRVELFISDHIQSPMTLGFFKPIVLVPGSFFTGLPTAQIEAILLHEIAHIRRHDYLINLMQLMVKTVFFYHPAIHYISRQIDEDREQACDDISVAQTRNPKALARGLANLRLMQNQAQTQNLTQVPSLTQVPHLTQMNASKNTPVATKMVMSATGPQDSALVNRLKRLIGEDPSARKPEHLILSAFTVIMIGSIGLGVAPLQAKASERINEGRQTLKTLHDLRQAERVSTPTIIEVPTVKVAKHDPIDIPVPPKPPIQATAPTPPMPPQTPQTPEPPIAPIWDVDSDELAGAPLEPSPWIERREIERREIERRAEDMINAQINRESHKADNLAHSQMRNQMQEKIEKEIERQLAHAKQQIKQAERQVKMSERAQARAERLAEKQSKTAHRSALEVKRFEEKMERAHSKELTKARRKFSAKQHNKYGKLETTLTQSLLSDGLIRSKDDRYVVTFSKGRAVVNGKPVPDKLVDKYCKILNNFGLYKNPHLKITSTADVFTFTSQSKDGQSSQTVSIGTFKHDNKTHRSHTNTQSHSQAHSKTHSKTQSHSHPMKHEPHSPGFIKPVSSNRTTTQFEKPTAYAPFHRGVDLSAPMLTPVRVSSNGVVQFVTTEPRWGKHIIVKHENGCQKVSRGQNVNTGRTIGTMGKTGSAETSPLHFEVLKDRTAINPETVIIGF